MNLGSSRRAKSRFGLWAVAALCLGSGRAEARNLDIDFSTEQGQVKAALAALGFAVVPNPYASLLFIERTGNANLTFRNGQLGGGITPFAGSPFYVELYGAFQNYAPDYAFDNQTNPEDVTVRWTSFSTTAGVGWNFALAPGLVLRPTLNLSLGRVTSNADVPTGDPGSGTDDFIAGDGLLAGGYGAALTLEYEYRAPELEVDLVARTTWMQLVPLGSYSDVDVTSDVATNALLARFRMPIEGWTKFGNPVRSVYEFTYADYYGDQGQVLDLPWLTRFGIGLEFDTSKLDEWAPSRIRVMLRVISGANSFTALSLGAGISF